MKYAIIAAGEGSRLSQEGIADPKPLISVCGERLIDRLIRVFVSQGATEVDVICNKIRPEVEQHLCELQKHGLDGKQIPLRYICQTTPSSMHSFFELSRLIDGDEPFVLTTVDTIFRADEFAQYVSYFEQAVSAGYDGVMGVTDYIDDEKPLYVDVADTMQITGFLDQPPVNARYISGGIYGLTPKALATLSRCVNSGKSRMRNFQRELVSEGQRLKAWSFSKVLDIDHVSDIAKAEQFLSENAE